MLLSKQLNRIKLEVNDARNGGHIVLSVPDGWNDSCKIVEQTITRDELRDLMYLVERALDIIAYEETELNR